MNYKNQVCGTKKCNRTNRFVRVGFSRRRLGLIGGFVGGVTGGGGGIFGLIVCFHEPFSYVTLKFEN